MDNQMNKKDKPLADKIKEISKEKVTKEYLNFAMGKGTPMDSRVKFEKKCIACNKCSGYISRVYAEIKDDCYIEYLESLVEEDREKVLDIVEKLKKKYKGANVCSGKEGRFLCSGLRWIPMEQMFEEELKSEIEKIFGVG